MIIGLFLLNHRVDLIVNGHDITRVTKRTMNKDHTYSVTSLMMAVVTYCIGQLFRQLLILYNEKNCLVVNRYHYLAGILSMCYATIKLCTITFLGCWSVACTLLLKHLLLNRGSAKPLLNSRLLIDSHYISAALLIRYCSAKQ